MKNKYDDALQEAFLKRAIQEAAEMDIAELEAMDVEVIPPTDKQRREIAREIRRAEKKGTAFKGISRAVAVIAIAFSITFAVLMFQPTVRATVIETVVSFFEKYVLFAFNDKTTSLEYKIGDYTITYLPSGYYLEKEEETPLNCKAIFSNGEYNIKIYLYKSSFSKTSFDNENTSSSPIKIGELDGYLLMDEDNLCKIVWGDETYTFTVLGSLAEKEILKIAKNIK